MERAENAESGGCLQRDSTECKEYAGAQSAARPETGETEVREPKLLEKILFRDNMNRAYKRVKANKGAPGVDGMTVEEALPWLKEHGKELTESIRSGKYKPQPVRRKEIPKPDGGVRKLGIPSVIDRIVQQAISQILAPIWEPIFSEGSYGYRPGRSAQDAILKIRGYVFDGYEWAVELDLSKYFDTLNHEKLLNLLRKEVTDERVIQLIKKFLKSGVMENGIRIATEEGSPQGGPLSPLLANIYLHEFDKEYEKRGVPVIRYADDIVLLCKSKRAAERLLESSTRYLEGKLKLKVNREKSRVTRITSREKFKFLGFAFRKYKEDVLIRVHPKSLKKAKAKLHELTRRNQGRNVKEDVLIRVHPKSLKKAKAKLHELTRRNQGRNVRQVMEKQKLFMQGWLNYYGLADMESTAEKLDQWLRRRYRMYIWKQWKRPRTKYHNLRKLGVSEKHARMTAGSRQSYWAASDFPAVKRAITKERLERAGYFNISKAYESIHEACILRTVAHTM